MVDLITQAEYARRRGVSREAVRQAIVGGRISAIDHGGRRMIDPAVADIQWAANTDRKQFERANGPKISASSPAAPSGDDVGRESVYLEAKARREEAEATMAELALAAMCAALVERAKVDEAAEWTHRRVAETILAIPAAVAPEIAALNDSFQVEQTLAAALRDALARLAQIPTPGPARDD